jgi:hypothetical protein
MIYLCTKFHISISYGSLVIAIKLISTYTFLAAAILFYILQEKSFKNHADFSNINYRPRFLDLTLNGNMSLPPYKYVHP